MIIRETDQHFVMTTQNEHAIFSSEIARGFTENLFIDRKYISDVLIAIQEHDRSWIRLDDTPTWNDRNSVPFSFVDYPLLPKLVLYKLGLDEVEEMNEYAALLCSLHYTSFKHIQRSKVTDCIDFIKNETNRQKRLKAKLGFPPEEMILAHFRLLQLCDEISLYVCMNNPGVSKEDEHPWYKEGFETTIGQQKVNAYWISNNEIFIKPLLFEIEMSATIKTKYVMKDLIKRVGIDTAYKETDLSEQEVIFRVNT
jgi:hypothetical protein